MREFDIAAMRISEDVVLTTWGMVSIIQAKQRDSSTTSIDLRVAI
ncbi:MAG TPA: hypothetical protein VIU38_04365 [Anaerolineales bacterium]